MSIPTVLYFGNSGLVSNLTLTFPTLSISHTKSAIRIFDPLSLLAALEPGNNLWKAVGLLILISDPASNLLLLISIALKMLCLVGNLARKLILPRVPSLQSTRHLLYFCIFLPPPPLLFLFCSYIIII